MTLEGESTTADPIYQAPPTCRGSRSLVISRSFNHPQTRLCERIFAAHMPQRGNRGRGQEEGVVLTASLAAWVDGPNDWVR